jgi:hypothetical protein
MKPAAVTALALLALVAASAAGAARPVSSISYVNQYVAYENQVAKIATKDKSSCARMATDLTAWNNANKATIANLNSASGKLSSVALALAALRDEGQIVSDAQTIASDVLVCSRLPAVAAALAAESKLKKP